MLRRTIISRLAALAVILTPALALAAGSAHDHEARPPRSCMSCDCARRSQTAAGATASSVASGTTSPEELQKIWTAP